MQPGPPGQRGGASAALQPREPGGGAAAQLKKRPPGPLDQLPYQRKLAFRRRGYAGFDDRVQNFLSKHHGADSVRVVFGCLMSRDDPKKRVVLPFGSEAVLDGERHLFSPGVLSHEKVRSWMRARHQAWATGDPAARRWAEVALTDAVGAAPPAARDAMTVWCPASELHYQLQVGASGPGAERRELSLQCFKTKGRSPAESLWWRLRLCQLGEDATAGPFGLELDVSAAFLWQQHARFQAGKIHSFSLLVRDVLRNARGVVALLRAPGAAPGGTPAAGPFYYPDLVGEKAAVREHYDKKAGLPASAGDKSLNANVRCHNNAIKYLLVEHFLDTLSPPIQVLDLACGHGQDIQKYLRRFRGPGMAKYVGVDFAEAAIAEARGRYASIVGASGGEVPATFYVGDLQAPDVYDQLERDGHRAFDVISVQFALHYLAESEDAMRTFLRRICRLLRPGGRVLGTIPSSEALADLYETLAGGAERTAGNSLFQVHFDGAAWRALEAEGTDQDQDVFSERWGLDYAFTLVGAVEHQREYVVPWPLLEEMAEGLGLQVVLDGAFPDILGKYRDTSPTCKDFTARGRMKELSQDEAELFALYSGFVLQREAEASPAD